MLWIGAVLQTLSPTLARMGSLEIPRPSHQSWDTTPHMIYRLAKTIRSVDLGHPLAQIFQEFNPAAFITPIDKRLSFYVARCTMGNIHWILYIAFWQCVAHDNLYVANIRWDDSISPERLILCLHCSAFSETRSSAKKNLHASRNQTR